MKILFYDNGLNTELAIACARAGHVVGYCTPWTEAFPRACKAYIGRGLEGLLPVESFSKALEQSDIIICPDTFSADRVFQARNAGKLIFGAGLSEVLEQNRQKMKRRAKDVGINIGPYKAVIGIDALIKELQSVTDVWVKTSKWRAIETFHHVDWESTKQQFLGPLLNEYGPVANELEFVIESPIKGQEVGADCIVKRGKFIAPYGYGYEAKDEAYIGTWADKLPPLLADTNAKLEQCFLPNLFGSFVSTEIRVESKNKGCLLEPTIRCPHPPTAGMLCMYDNIPEVITDAEHRLKPSWRYCAVLVMRSSWAGDHWCEIEIKKQWRNFVKLSQACRINDKFFAVPGNEFVGYLCGVGNTIPEAVKMAKKTAENVKCRDMDVNPSALDCLMDETIPKGKELGIHF